MNTAYKVAMVGFSQKETSTLESFFRRAAKRPPRYFVQEEVLDAQVLLVNADNAQALALVQGANLPGRVLLLGSQDGNTGWLLLRTPIRFVGLLSSLDVLVSEQDSGHATPAPSFAETEPLQTSHLPNAGDRTRQTEDQCEQPGPFAPQATAPHQALKTKIHPTGEVTQAVFDGGSLSLPVLAEVPRSLPEVKRLKDAPPVLPPQYPARNTPSPRVTRFGRDDPLVPEELRGDALLVSQSLVEGRILLKRFLRYELSIDWCRDPSQFHKMIRAHSYRLIIIDSVGGDPDAFQMCQLAKQCGSSAGAPTVLLFAPKQDSANRMKAHLAGADACLSRSVGEAALHKFLEQNGLTNLNEYVPTSFNSL